MVDMVPMSVESVKDDAVGTNKLGMQAGLFTRAQTGDNRGESMMAKHQNALQQVRHEFFVLSRRYATMCSSTTAHVNI
eukprot:1155839-Pelagomonas_calceolata.AAC.23